MGQRGDIAIQPQPFGKLQGGIGHRAAAEHGQVVDQAALENGRLAGEQANLIRTRPRIGRVQRRAIIQDLSAGRPPQTGDQGQHRRAVAVVGADDTHRFARPDGEADVIQQGLPGAVVKADITEFNLPGRDQGGAPLQSTRLLRQGVESQDLLLGQPDRLEIAPDSHGAQQRLHDTPRQQRRAGQLTDGHLVVDHQQRAIGQHDHDGKI